MALYSEQNSDKFSFSILQITANEFAEYKEGSDKMKAN